MPFEDDCFTPRPLSRRNLRGFGLMTSLFMLGACNASQREETAFPSQEVAGPSARQEITRMWMTVDTLRFSVTLADTDAARAFAARLPLTLDMAELNGNEKYADLPQALPTDASRPSTIRNGDLLLYGSKTVVIFYETFHSSYSYTPLGHVDNPEDLGKALGRDSSRVFFSK